VRKNYSALPGNNHEVVFTKRSKSALECGGAKNKNNAAFGRMQELPSVIFLKTDKPQAR
jgi:hypothetical protein